MRGNQITTGLLCRIIEARAAETIFYRSNAGMPDRSEPRRFVHKLGRILDGQRPAVISNLRRRVRPEILNRQLGEPTVRDRPLAGDSARTAPGVPRRGRSVRHRPA